MHVKLLKASFLLLLSAGCLLPGCKTKEDNPSPQSYWTLNGSTHKVSSTVVHNAGSYELIVSDGDNTINWRYNSAVFTIETKPVTDGEILIGNAAGKLQIQTIDGGEYGKETRYLNPAASPLKANVSFNDGKLTLDIPEITLKQEYGSREQSFSAHIVEQ